MCVYERVACEMDRAGYSELDWAGFDLTTHGWTGARLGLIGLGCTELGRLTKCERDQNTPREAREQIFSAWWKKGGSAQKVRRL